jgi:hypothetical protein
MGKRVGLTERQIWGKGILPRTVNKPGGPERLLQEKGRAPINQEWESL